MKDNNFCVDEKGLKVYLASPYGYTEAGRHFMYETLLPLIEKSGCDVLNPWDLNIKENRRYSEISSIGNYNSRVIQLKKINKRIGVRNEETIRQADLVIAVIEGQEVDSGVR